MSSPPTARRCDRDRRRSCRWRSATSCSEMDAALPPLAHRDGWLAWQLADSAFPTGGFAHSWGLEAAWQSGEIADAAALARFLDASIAQAGRAGLPFLNAAHTAPSRLAELDRRCDVFI